MENPNTQAWASGKLQWIEALEVARDVPQVVTLYFEGDEKYQRPPVWDGQKYNRGLNVPWEEAR